VAVVIDPVQSIKGRVVMDAFRSIPPQNIMNNSEPRCTTSNEGVLKRPQREALLRGLNRLFYSMVINSRTNDTNEISMLSKLHKP
jgi:26S proteasome regulatory subunit N11